MKNRKTFETLKKRYPWFEQCSWDCPGGWSDLCVRLCMEIAPILSNNGTMLDYRVLCVEEKYGELRWHDNCENKDIESVVSKYERESMSTCVNCGKKKESKDYDKKLCEECKTL